MLEEFELQEGEVAYNPTVPFVYKNKLMIIARVENRDDDYTAFSIFFEKKGSKWRRSEDFKEIKLQDPFLTKIDGEFLLGGVEAENHDNETYDFRTALYKGDELEDLKLFYIGPNKSKGLRICKLRNSKYVVLSRPMFPSDLDKDGRGRLAYKLTDDITDLDTDFVKSQIIEGILKEKEWGGANQIFELENGNVGILGHRAFFGENGIDKIYVSTAIELDVLNNKIVLNKDILERSVFPDFQPLRPFLENVLYTSGMIATVKDDVYNLYVGISDIRIGYAEIQNPFSSKPILVL